MRRSAPTPGRQLSRQELKVLRARARAGNVEAAVSILAHSVALRHRRLSVRRYMLAMACGSDQLSPFAAYCESVAADLPLNEIRGMAEDVARLVSAAQGNAPR